MGHESLKEVLRGVAFTLPTPFSDDTEEVLEGKLKQNVTAIENEGGELFLPCGNTGEYYSLTAEERTRVVSSTVEAAGDNSAVIGGIGGSTKEAIDLGRRYQDAGVDGVMIMDPDHTYQHEQGVLKYHRQIIDALDIPVVLYKRGPALSEDVIAELSTEEDVVAVKYAVNDINAFSRAIENTPGDVVWSNGIAERFTPSFAIEGAEGFTTGIGNFVPGPVLELMDAVRNKRWEQAREIRDILRPYEELREQPGKDNVIANANNVPAVKSGMELAGLYGGPVREPLVELGSEDKERAEEYYEKIQESLPGSTADL